ncbi:hypothetical protein Patl1_21324 [Pistacia atlantica]|uniref:Uncharacterized protein n=1 Tax=Pistacia atlantica TaxID=434234 RepID=A0ACC1BN85_9ROSI|nr:hypothetical protein Patl1_21324 [Pistacia atlantica]
MELVAYVKKMANPLRPFWNWIYIGLCVSAISLDPLFFYIPVVNDDKKCIGFDRKLGIVAVVLRSCSDFFHMFYILFQLRPQAYAVDDFRASNRRRNTLYHHYPRKTARKYLMRFFPIDLLSILPLPQLIIITMIRGSKHPKALELLKFFVIFQYVPRAIRIFPLITKARMDGGLIAEGALVKASFNLFLYMLASHDRHT